MGRDPQAGGRPVGGGVVTPDRRRTLGRRRSSQISYRYFLRETFLFVVLFFFCWFVLFLRMTKRSTPRRPFGFSEAVDSRGLWALSLSLSLSLSLCLQGSERRTASQLNLLQAVRILIGTDRAEGQSGWLMRKKKNSSAVFVLFLQPPRPIEKRLRKLRPRKTSRLAISSRSSIE